MKTKHVIASGFIAAFLTVPAYGQQIMPWENRTETDSDPFAKTTAAMSDKLLLEDVVNGSILQTKGAGTMTWLKDGERYSRIEPDSNNEGKDVVAYRAKDNKREVIVPSSMFIDKQSGKHIPIRSISWSNDNNKLLVYNNTRRVWRYDTRGDYWVLDLKSGNLHQLGKGLPEASLMFAKFSPDGSRVAYVSCNNLYVEDTNTGEIIQLTHDGNDKIINGTFDWVYEEEFACRDGFRWSPDGETIAFWNSDTDGTGFFDMINYTDSIYPRIIHFPYPKAGSRNSAVRVGYVSSRGGDTKWVEIPGDMRENYIPRMEFIPESNDLFIQQMNRQQNTNKVWVCTIGETKPKHIFTDSDPNAWVETNDNVTWLDDNKWFTWESERDGWRQLYRVCRDGKLMKKSLRANLITSSR